MQQTQKSLLKYALDYNIKDVSTYPGYKGDLIVKITSHNKADILAIRQYAISLNILDIVVKWIPHLELYELYCATKDDHHHLIEFDENDIPKIKTHKSSILK